MERGNSRSLICARREAEDDTPGGRRRATAAREREEGRWGGRTAAAGREREDGHRREGDEGAAGDLESCECQTIRRVEASYWGDVLASQANARRYSYAIPFPNSLDVQMEELVAANSNSQFHPPMPTSKHSLGEILDWSAWEGVGREGLKLWRCYNGVGGETLERRKKGYLYPLARS
jgi:hypothetical protein